MASLAESVSSYSAGELAQLQAHLLESNFDYAMPAERAAFVAPDHTTSTRQDLTNSSERLHSPTPAISCDEQGNHTNRINHGPVSAGNMLAPPKVTQADGNNVPPSHSYPGGDTQPMDTQIYHEYAQSMIDGNVAGFSHSHELAHQIQSNTGAESQPGRIGGVEGSPRTYQEGDAGFINLQAWEPQSPENASDAETGYDDLLTAQVETQTYSASAVPVTPATVHRKNAGAPETMTSTIKSKTGAKTPGTSQWLESGHKAQYMSTTQLFHQTQALSSPLPDHLRSDPIVSRPSPNFNHIVDTSPLPPMASSPVQTLAPIAQLTSEELRDTYTSMRESQELRAGRVHQEHSRSFGHAMEDQDDVDLGFDAVRHNDGRPPLRRARSEQTCPPVAKAKMTPRNVHAHALSRRTPLTIDLTTPLVGVSQFHAREPTIEEQSPVHAQHSGEHDPVQNSPGPHEELPADGGKDDDSDIEEEEDIDDDQYDEFAQEVFQSQPPDVDSDGATTDVGEEDEQDQNNSVIDASQGNCTTIARVAASDSVEVVNGVSNTPRSTMGQTRPEQAPEPSSLCSFVPGSQYTGKTSQDRARVQAAEWRDRSSARSGTEIDPDQISSSPPAGNGLRIDNVVTESPSSSPNGHMKLSVQETRPPRGQQEIPDSDITTVGPDEAMTADVARPATALLDESGPLYSTAQTHVSAAVARSPVRISLSSSQPLKALRMLQAGPSPRKMAGVRNFAEITFAPSQPSGNTQDDIDAVVQDIFTADDEHFKDLISGSPSHMPLSKRRRVRSPMTPRRRGMIEIPPEEPATIPTPAQDQSRSGDAGDRDLEQVLCVSPSKANQLPSLTVEEGTKIASDTVMTHDIPREHEQLRKLTETQRMGPQKGHNSQNRRVKKTYSGRKKAPVVVHDESSTAGDSKLESTKTPLPEQSHIPAAEATDHGGDDQKRSDKGDDDHEKLPVICPNRVLALFRGQYNRHYPATWLARNPDGKTHRVQFDDTTILDLEAHHICRFELHKHDVVRIDQPKMKGKSWVVQGFGPAVDRDEGRAVGSDQFGRVNVRVQAKATGHASTAGGVIAEGAVLDVPMAAINVPRTSWHLFVGRAFQQIPPQDEKLLDRAVTPSGGARTPPTRTPGSRNRRSTLIETVSATNSIALPHDEGQDRMALGDRGRVFQNMAFTLTFTRSESEEHDKARLTRLVADNGALVLETGFDELFNISEVEHAESSGAGALEIKADFQNVGFVAMITDQHSRRAKFMQALALGLPTLSSRWILDSLDARKNPTLDSANPQPLPWARYLLPAGESQYLGGAIRSRTIPLYSASDAKLVDVIQQRNVLLNDEGVLIVVTKKNKAHWERRRPYVFLTLALGASRVARVSDLDEAQKQLAEEPGKWKWVYVEGLASESSPAVSKKRKSAAGSKRKRDADDATANLGARLGMEAGQVKIVDDEFVIQSLILGALVE